MIWVIGGTSDAIKIVDLLLTKNKAVLVSTTTQYGSDLAERAGVTIIQKMLDLTEMIALLERYAINCVIDASHPFAELVSKNSMRACSMQNVKYLRFERESIEFKNANYYNNYEQMVDVLQNLDGRILLTIGSKNIIAFKALETDRLIARVLPVQKSIGLCENAGLKLHQIIAVKGRLSMQTNKALILEYEIGHLVTKDSGEAGGLNEKIEAAEELGVKVHILKKPEIKYPTALCSLSEIIKKI